MNKLLLRSLVLIVMITVFTSLAFAGSADTGPASVYKVGVSKVELDNGTSYITVFNGTSGTLDIASVSSGASVGDFLSGLEVPDGTYYKVKVTPSPTFTYSGNVGTNYTTAGEGEGGSPPGTIGQKGAWTITLTGDNVPTAKEQDFTATPVTVLNGVVDHEVRVSFNVANAIKLEGGKLWPDQPTVTISLQ
ncbi:MAG: hypothetical protein NTW13_00360 [Candidatus Omnitrophica bacterium]|nr:hypothetical protein [Candidatus Omnitrophota bacterium]